MSEPGPDNVLEEDVHNGELGHAAKHNDVNSQVNYLTGEVAGRLSEETLDAGLGAAAAALPPHKLAAGTEPGPVVCWTGDDGYGFHAPFFGLLNTRGLKGTMFATSTWIDKAGVSATWANDTYITKVELQNIATAGHEIGTHGVTHENMPDYLTDHGVAALAALFDTVVDYLEDNFVDVHGDPIKILTGAYPYGRSDRRVREIAGRRHLFHRGTKGAVATEAWNPFDVPAIDVLALTEAQIKAYIDTALAEAAPVVFLVHGQGAGGTRDAMLTKLGNCMDYATGLGIPQKSFADAMTERNVRRSPGHMVDTSGNAFFRRLRTQRMTLSRSDTKADSAWFDLDLVNNAAYADGNNGQPFDYRGSGLRVTGSAFKVGRRFDYAGATVTGSPQVTIPLLSLDDSAIGVGVSGAGIPAGAKIGSYDATHINLVDAGGAAVNATATATVTVTIAWPAAPTTSLYGAIEFHKQPRAIGASSGTGYSINTLDGTQTLLLKAGGISRFTSGTFTIDTAGGVLELEAARLRLQPDGGTPYMTFAPSVPTDGNIVNSEVVIFFDVATGNIKYRYKDAGGTATTKTVTAA